VGDSTGRQANGDVKSRMGIRAAQSALRHPEKTGLGSTTHLHAKLQVHGTQGKDAAPLDGTRTMPCKLPFLNPIEDDAGLQSCLTAPNEEIRRQGSFVQFQRVNWTMLVWANVVGMEACCGIFCVHWDTLDGSYCSAFLIEGHVSVSRFDEYVSFIL